MWQREEDVRWRLQQARAVALGAQALVQSRREEQGRAELSEDRGACGAGGAGAHPRAHSADTAVVLRRRFEETAEAAKAERRGIDKSIPNRPPFGNPTSFDAPRDRCVLGRRAMTTQGARCHYKAGCPRERCGWAGPHYFGWAW